MRSAFRGVLVIALLAFIAGCSSGAPRKQINPPRASIQQLAVQPDGQWQLTMRLQNFSNIPTMFETVSMKLKVADQDAGSMALSPAMTIGPESADVVTTLLRPALGAKLQVASALTTGQPVRYSVAGTIVTREPKGSYEVSYESTLNPAPGLNGVMR